MPVATGFSCCDIISFPIESNIVIIGTSDLLRKADLTPDAQLSITRASLPEIALRFFSKVELAGYCERNFLNLISGANRVYGHQVVIMEVLDMVGKLLKIILPDKIENRKAEVHKQALDLSPGYSDSFYGCFVHPLKYLEPKPQQ